MLDIIDNVLTSAFFLGVVWLLAREIRSAITIFQGKDRHDC